MRSNRDRSVLSPGRGCGSRRREAGRALTLVLAAVAVVAVGGLGMAIVGVLAPDSVLASIFEGRSDAHRSTHREAAEAGIASPAEAGSRADPLPRTEAANIAGPGASRSRAADPRADISSVAGLRRLGGGSDSSPAAAAGRRLAGAAQRGGTRSGLSTSRGDAASEASDAAEATPDRSQRKLNLPGYAEILGVIPRTPGYSAHLQRNWQILEYNGQGVDGTATLRDLWGASGLPESVSLGLRDPKTGEKFTIDVPSGPLGLLLAPEYLD